MKNPFKEAAPKGAPYQKWSDCVHDVAKKGGAYNPYAVCGASVKREACGRKMPGQSAFECESNKESLSSSGATQLTRAGVKK